MADVFILTKPRSTNIEYSIVDGRIRSFVLRGETLFDEDSKIAVPEWKGKLVEFVIQQRLNIDKHGHGLHAFIYRLQEEGLLR